MNLANTYQSLEARIKANVPLIFTVISYNAFKKYSLSFYSFPTYVHNYVFLKSKYFTNVANLLTENVKTFK